jgi:hypothetical protein
MSSWFDSGHALLLIVLAVSAVLFVSSKDCPAADRSKYYLCAWLISAEALLLCNIHPTFQQYFVFVVPFLAILAPVGLRALTLRFDSTGRPLWPVLFVGAFLAFGLEKSLFEQRDNRQLPCQPMNSSISPVSASRRGGLSMRTRISCPCLRRLPPGSVSYPPTRLKAA